MGESIERQLGRMETKLDELIKEKDREPERRKFVNGRIDKLENWQARIIAAGGAALFLIAAAYKVIFDLVRISN